MAEPQDSVLPIRRGIRTDIRDRRRNAARAFTVVNRRLDQIERRSGNLQAAVDGESLLGRYAAAEVEERVDAIETRPAALGKAH
ncbi:hypothetical protein [Methylobacterium sp.]|uniref:hypothetical protein n=1 Tax=Methylobacterium sp. TaxID=409 RepID=UPI003B00F41F